MSRFAIGESYFAVPTMAGANKRIVTVAGRGHGRVALTFPTECATARVESVDGREIARITADDGRDYLVASTVRADVAAAADVMDAIATKRARRRVFFTGG